MKIASQRICAGLVIIGLLVSNQAYAQQQGASPIARPSFSVAMASSPQWEGLPPAAIESADPTGMTPGALADPPGGLPAMDGDFADSGLMAPAEAFGPAMVDQTGPTCGGGAGVPPLWSVTQGVRALYRSRPRGIQLTSQLSAATLSLTPELSTRSIGFDPAVGYTATLRRHLGRDAENRDHFLEFTYWGLNHWDLQRRVRGSRLTAGGVEFGSLFSPFAPTANVFDSPVGGFNRADEQFMSYVSEIHNFEWDLRLTPRRRHDRLVLQPNGRWRRECTPGQYFSYLLGIRYSLINEHLLYQSRGVIDNGGTMYQTEGIYNVDTTNNILGFQIGADAMFRYFPGSWGFHAKVGPFYNFAHQQSKILTDAAGDPYATTHLDEQLRDTREQVTVIGEVGAMGEYRLSPNCMVRGTFDLMWMTGLALAPEQLTFAENPVGFVNTNGHAFLEGVTLEMELTW